MNTAPKSILSWLMAVLLALGAFGAWWLYFKPTPDDGSFVRGNGRIEATEVDVATKVAGRVAEILFNEGDFVREGDVVAHMDTQAIQAKLAQGKADVANAKSARATALAQVAQRKAEVVTAQAQLVRSQAELAVAQKSNTRVQGLYAQTATSAQDADNTLARVRSAEASVAMSKAQISAAQAAVTAAEAQVEQAVSSIEAAEAVLTRLNTELDDCVLRAPRSGRVQYRIVQPGEVIAGGGKVVSIVDISDVYMSFFLPERAAGRVALGTEVRLVLDAAPHFVIPAQVSYVASVAQFTPKSVETQSERQKMMFRVKARIDPELLQTHPEQVKTGLPGMAHVRLKKDTPWPQTLQVNVQ